MKLLVELGKVISELEEWEKKYLPDNPQPGKIKLIDIVDDTPLNSVINGLEWNQHQQEADKVKAECTKVLQWFRTGNGVLSQNLNDNPFVTDGKSIGLKLTDTLREIEKNLKADLEGQKPTETGQKANIPRGRRTWIGVKKVVEKGWQIFTKSFWESVLDRVWHRPN